MRHSSLIHLILCLGFVVFGMLFPTVLNRCDVAILVSVYPALNIISSGAVCARPYVLAAYVLVSYVPTAMCPPYVPKTALGASSAAKILRGGDPTFA